MSTTGDSSDSDPEPDFDTVHNRVTGENPGGSKAINCGVSQEQTSEDHLIKLIKETVDIPQNIKVILDWIFHTSEIAVPAWHMQWPPQKVPKVTSTCGGRNRCNLQFRNLQNQSGFIFLSVPSLNHKTLLILWSKAHPFTLLHMFLKLVSTL